MVLRKVLEHQKNCWTERNYSKDPQHLKYFSKQWSLVSLFKVIVK